jgi:hypothetical protein
MIKNPMGICIMSIQSDPSFFYFTETDFPQLPDLSLTLLEPTPVIYEESNQTSPSIDELKKVCEIQSLYSNKRKFDAEKNLDDDTLFLPKYVSKKRNPKFKELELKPIKIEKIPLYCNFNKTASRVVMNFNDIYNAPGATECQKCYIVVIKLRNIIQNYFHTNKTKNTNGLTAYTLYHLDPKNSELLIDHSCLISHHNVAWISFRGPYTLSNTSILIRTKAGNIITIGKLVNTLLSNEQFHKFKEENSALLRSVIYEVRDRYAISDLRKYEFYINLVNLHNAIVDYFF